MTRIATYAVQQLALSKTTQAQARSQDLQIQVSTGKKAQQYSGIASDSQRLLDSERLRAIAQRFSASIDEADRRLQAMETATAESFDAASDLRSLLLTALSANNADLLVLDEQAKNMLEQVAGLLNLELDGRYLFGGSRTDVAPIDLDALFNPVVPKVDAIEFTGAATTAGTGFTALQGIVSIQVPSGSFGDSLQLTYDGAGQLTLTNLVNGGTDTLTVSAPPSPGETADYVFNVAGTEVTVTIDDQFAMATPITNQPITGTVGGGAGAFGAISFVSTLGDISKIASNVIDVASGTADASDITLTLPSSDGNFVATGLDFETAPGVQIVTLTNATTGAEVTLSIDVAVALVDATVNDPGTEINLGDALINVAATAGATSNAAALPGELNYDPSDPSFYQGDTVKLSLRAGEDVDLRYGVTAIEPGFEKLIRAIFLTMQAGTPGSVNTTDLDTALGLVNEAIAEIPDIRGRIGTARKSLENLKDQHESMTLLADNTIGEAEDVDVAQAMTLLAQTTTQVEASFSTLVRLTNLSLLDFV